MTTDFDVAAKPKTNFKDEDSESDIKQADPSTSKPLDADYVSNVKLVQRYLDFQAMFEIKDGQDYKMFKDINEDPFTWKVYEHELI